MNTYAVDIQAAAAVAPFNVAVTAPEGFDQAERRAIRRAVQRAQEWNAAHAGENLPHRPESRDEYRVVSIGLTV